MINVEQHVWVPEGRKGWVRWLWQGYYPWEKQGLWGAVSGESRGGVRMTPVGVEPSWTHPDIL